MVNKNPFNKGYCVCFFIVSSCTRTVLHIVAYNYKISIGGACLQLSIRSLYHLTIPIIGLVTATLTKICFNLWLHVLSQKSQFNEKIQYFASYSKFNFWYVKCISNVLWEGDFSEKFLKIHRKIYVPDSLFNIVGNLQPATLLKKILRQKCFHVNFTKFFRAALLQNRSDTLLLFLLLLLFFLLLSIPDKFVLNFLNNCSLIVRDLFLPQNLLSI